MIDQKPLENAGYFSCNDNNDAIYTCEIKSRIAMAKAAFSKEKTFHQQTGLLRRKLVKCYIWCIAL
jgi:hypothetical protein